MENNLHVKPKTSICERLWFWPEKLRSKMEKTKINVHRLTFKWLLFYSRNQRKACADSILGLHNIQFAGSSASLTIRPFRRPPKRVLNRRRLSFASLDEFYLRVFTHTYVYMNQTYWSDNEIFLSTKDNIANLVCRRRTLCRFDPLINSNCKKFSTLIIRPFRYPSKRMLNGRKLSFASLPTGWIPCTGIHTHLICICISNI